MSFYVEIEHPGVRSTFTGWSAPWKWKAYREKSVLGVGYAYTEERAKRKAEKVISRQKKRDKKAEGNYTYEVA